MQWWSLRSQNREPLHTLIPEPEALSGSGAQEDVAKLIGADWVV